MTSTRPRPPGPPVMVATVFDGPYEGLGLVQGDGRR